MPMTRKFLDWSRPALPAAVDFLLAEYGVLGVVDLQNVIAVVPGGRAGRRLLELLVERAGEALTPPEIITMGHLPERLYEPKRPFATDFVQKLAWAEALRDTPPAELRTVVPHPPRRDDFENWLRLGELLWNQHRELAADGLDFAHVARMGPELDEFDEADRWHVLHQVQQAYLARLDELELWDKQTARLFAIEHGECRTDKDVVLIGIADANQSLRRMLDQVADRVTALVHAPEDLRTRFDEHGCLAADAWQDVKLDVLTSEVRVVDGPVEQADEVARALAEFDGRYSADEITIGITDEELVPQVQRQLELCSVPTRWVVGQQLPESAPFRLLEAVGEYLERERFDTFAALVRHPHVHDWLDQQGLPDDWLIKVDEYYAQHLQPAFGEWLGEDETVDAVRQVHDTLAALLDPLRTDPRPLGDWSEPLVQLLLNVYANVDFDQDDEVQRTSLEAARKLHDTLIEHTKVPRPLAPNVSAAEAIRLLLDETRRQPIPPLPDHEAVELLGWLELPLDDAPALVVTTFNEGYVPSSLNSDLFMPNGLRRHLGVVDNARRYARDAYALSVLLASRRELVLIVARRDVKEDALAPSRLLFAADSDTVAQRVLSFFEPEDDGLPKPPLVGTLQPGREASGFCVPRPEQTPPLQRMSVTSFRSYLACPYRFYLQHVLRLESVDDTAEELDGGSFGNLAHDVLARFGRDAIRSSTDQDEIFDYLAATLETCARERYGEERLPAVNVQVEQLRARLKAFAEWQAGWRDQGWEIHHAEDAEGRLSVPFPLGDGRQIELVGKIDRIDRRGDEWIVFDYKTGERGSAPEAAHRTNDEWVDLQLPLYRHLVRAVGIEPPVGLGYIVLPRDTADVRELLADWPQAMLEDADRVARDVARAVLDQQFWPPQDVPERTWEEFAGICQDGVFERRLQP